MTKVWELASRLVRSVWIWFSILTAALWPTRVALLLIVAGAFMLVFHEQGQDLAIRLVETEAGWLPWTLFFCATAWWAVQSWLWSRIALENRFGILGTGQQKTRTLQIRLFDGTIVDSAALDWMVRGIPRLYALSVFVLAATAILRAGGGHKVSGWLFVLAGVCLAVFLWRRRSLLDPRRLPGRLLLARAAAVAVPTPGRFASLFGATSAARFLTKAALVVASVMAVGVWWWPGAQTFGVFLGAPTVTFFAFASILAALGLAGGASRQFGFPVIATLLVVGAIVAVVLPLPDHHRIPVVDRSLDGRRSLATALDQWNAANPVVAAGMRPIVFVATAGGGVRAALWTAVVLDRARQADPAFDKRLFALSGVSGGALGATAYIAGLSSDAAGPPGPCSDSAQHLGLCSFGQLGRRMFEADMLGPTFAAAFYGDLFFTFVPLPVPINSADALTESWRQAWRAAAPKTPDTFSQPFLAHWRGASSWRPVLMLNGTHVESGKRLITSDLKLDDEDVSVRDAWDLHKIVNGDIDTSMAALNAARFPGVVAAGTVTTQNGTRWGHVIDGGYFENSGAVAADELAGNVARKAGVSARLKPIFIEIVSDPQLNSRDSARDTSLAACSPNAAAQADVRPGCEAAQPIGFLIGARGPAQGILNVRSGHGIWAPRHFADDVKQLFRDENGLVVGTFVQFRLCPPEAAARVPLGWQLSGASAQDIIRSLPTTPGGAAPTAAKDSSAYVRWQCEKANADSLEKLRTALLRP